MDRREIQLTRPALPYHYLQTVLHLYKKYSEQVIVYAVILHQKYISYKILAIDFQLKWSVLKGQTDYVRCKVVKLSQQCCGQIRQGLFETYKTFSNRLSIQVARLTETRDVISSNLPFTERHVQLTFTQLEKRWYFQIINQIKLFKGYHWESGIALFKWRIT